jgi:hypothetical protein
MGDVMHGGRFPAKVISQVERPDAHKMAKESVVGISSMAFSYRLPDRDHFPPTCMHPHAKDIESETDAYFANAWPWRSSEERSKFLLSNLSGYVPSCPWDFSMSNEIY